MTPSVSDLTGAIEKDLDWRHAELAIFREMLTLDHSTEARRSVLYRAAWALLYAHYEGFCKYGLQLFAEHIANLENCSSLSHETFLFVHAKSIREAKNFDSAKAYEFFRNTVDKLRLESPPVVIIDTKSNLWPDLLEEFLVNLNINKRHILENREKIKTLVSRRNDIAHGQRVFIKDLRYYLEYEDATRNLMYALALGIVESAESLI